MRHEPVKAAFCMVGAMAIVALVDSFVTVLAQDVSLWQFQFLRACLAVPILLGLDAFGWIVVRPISWGAVLIRNGLIAVGMLFYFGSLGFLPLTQALAGLFVAPVFVLVISVLAFGDKVGFWRSAAVVTGFAGVLIVLSPWDSELGWLVLMPMVGGLLYAMGSVVTQRLCADEATPAMLLGLFGLQGVFGLAALGILAVWQPVAPEGADGFLLRGWVWPTGVSWQIIVIQAIGSLIGVGLLIRAYQLAAPSFVATFENSIFLFGPVFAYFLFSEGMTTRQGLGIAMIIAAGLLIATRGRRQE